MKVWMHTVEPFYAAKNDIQSSLKSGARPVIAALVATYKELLANPLVFQNSDQRDGDDFLHPLGQHYKLVYRVEPEFQNQSTLIAQHVYLKNIVREK